MTEQGKWVVGLVLLIAFGFLVIHTPVGMGAQAERLEARLLARAQSQLAAVGADWAQVEMRGQKAILTGRAPSNESLREARGATFRAAGPGYWIAGGVTAVNHSGVTVAPPREGPYSLTALLDPAMVTLTGTAPSEADVTALVDRAIRLFPTHDVANELTVDAYPPSEDWITLAEVALDSLRDLQTGSAVITDEALRVVGDASDASSERAVLAAVERAADRFVVSTDITSPPPVIPAPEPVIEIEPEVEPEPEPLLSALDAFVIAQPPAQALEEPVEEQSPEEAPEAEIDIAAVLEPLAEIVEEEPLAPVEETIDTVAACQARFDAALADNTIIFTTNSARITPDSHPLLEQIAAIARACSAFSISIEGHTDGTGTDETNQKLSGDRAYEVLEYLRTAGVPIDRLSASGFGDTRPVATNDTAEGRRQNRRIELVVTQ